MIGFLNVYKPSGMTSNYVVQKIKKQFNIKKIGHMGTLDPMASGILPIAIGKATRLFDYMLSKTKKYIVTYQFGYETDTLDATGNIVADNGKIPTIDEIVIIIKNMIGKQQQLPPKYSAKNINGSRAYDLARKGIDFELSPKEIEIFDIKLLSNTDTEFSFAVTCSSGTYIRSIGRDIAYKLGTFATMTRLERVETGCFKKDQSISFDELLKYDSIEDIIISPTQVFENFVNYELTDQEYIDLLNGKTISYRNSINHVFLKYKGELIGISKTDKDYLKLDTYLEEK